jgi:hypothetical protein
MREFLETFALKNNAATQMRLGCQDSIVNVGLLSWVGLLS